MSRRRAQDRAPALPSSSAKAAIITGTARKNAIGRACVRSFLKAGYTVVGIDKTTPEGLDTDAVLQQHASSLQFIEADLQDEVQLEDAAKRACTWLGRVNVLVNNAGIAQPYMPGTRQERSKLWHSYIATNLTAAFLLSEAVVPEMPDGDSCIINISSTRAKQSEPWSEGYAAAKSGLLGLTHAQAVSLGPKTRVNAVLPGYIYTDDADPNTELSQEDHDWHPAGRVGEPEDVAELCLFLADNQRAEFITGQEFTVDGGVSKKMVYPE